MRWLKEGDANSKFFKACVKSRRASNHITALQPNNGWVEDVFGVKKEVVHYFSKVFPEDIWVRSRLDGIEFESISVQQNEQLTRVSSLEEIEEILNLSDGDKSQGPDDFNYSFFKSCWGVLKDDVFNMFAEFHCNARLPLCLTSYFLTLIPKIASPCIGDFRPISLLGSLYKLISKVLAARLAVVMDSIISSNQSAFFKEETYSGWSSGYE